MMPVIMVTAVAVSGVSIVDERLRIGVVDGGTVRQHPDVDARHQEQQHTEQSSQQFPHHLPGRLISHVEIVQFRWLKFQRARQGDSRVGTMDRVSRYRCMGISVSSHRRVFPREIGLTARLSRTKKFFQTRTRLF